LGNKKKSAYILREQTNIWFSCVNLLWKKWEIL